MEKYSSLWAYVSFEENILQSPQIPVYRFCNSSSYDIFLRKHFTCLVAVNSSTNIHQMNRWRDAPEVRKISNFLP